MSVSDVSTTYSDALIDQMMFWTFLAEASFTFMMAGIVARYWRRSFPLVVVEVMFGISATAAFIFYKLRVAIIVALAFATAPRPPWTPAVQRTCMMLIDWIASLSRTRTSRRKTNLLVSTCSNCTCRPWA